MITLSFNINKPLFGDFISFCIPYLYSKDVDPVYPILREVSHLRGREPEQTAEHVAYYLTWYHLGSAERMLSRGLAGAFPVLPTGLERRGFRGAGGAVKAQTFLTALMERKPLIDWIRSVTEAGGKAGWRAMFAEFQTLPYCGTWAAYKWCDLCRNVLGFPITAPNIGYGGGGEYAGPVPGMVQLTGLPWMEAATNEHVQEQLCELCRAHGVMFDGIEQMETALCDFNSMIHGRYYVGHDLDKQMEDLIGNPDVYWQARTNTIPHKFLGEKNGWFGVRKNLCKSYLIYRHVYRGADLC